MLIKPLTALRFIFAFMVFCSHLSYLQESSNPTSQWIYHNLFYEGYVGVSFFFILSGFILAYVYQARLIDKTVSTKRFYIARLARIYPLHVLTFLIAIPLEFWNQNIDWQGIAKGILHLFLVQSLVPIQEVYFSYNGPAWSISTEAMFYLVFPLLVMFIAKSKSWLRIIVIGLMAISIPLLMNTLPMELWHSIFYINPVGRIVDFCLGIALFQVISKWEYRARFKTSLEFIAVFLFLVFYAAHSWIPDIYRYSVYYWFPMLFIIAVFWFQQGWLSKILSHRLALWLGEISFGFYLFHQLVYRYFLLSNGYVSWIESDWIIAVTVFTISLTAAGFSYKYFETPINRWLRQRLS